MISRRTLLAAIPPALVMGRARAAPPKALIGAIRWDAWYGKSDDSVYPQNNLAPTDYQKRAPIHCSVGNGEVSCIGTQSVMDAEIRAASRAGIAFWAFDWFPPSSSLRIAWSLYQSSSLNQLVKWCPILGLAEIGSASSSQEEIKQKHAAWVARMGAPNFFGVDMQGVKRPLVFLYYRADELNTYFKNTAALHASIDGLRKTAISANVGNPYVVIFDPALDMGLFRESGADAISNYIGNFKTRPGATFVDLDSQIRRYWDRMAATGAPMIPIAQIGWDTRPRLDHPVPWAKPGEGEVKTTNSYFPLASPNEFSAHMKEAISFIDSHAASCPSRVILLYSWDECDEGGCIMPTLGDPTGKYLAAISEALK
jgi:hypothetical protein